MAKHTCIGCGNKFANSNSLSYHYRYCKKFKNRSRRTAVKRNEQANVGESTQGIEEAFTVIEPDTTDAESPGTYVTEPNYFGVYRVYDRKPTFIPPDATVDDILPSRNILLKAPAPQLSITKELLMSWMYNGSTTKSLTDIDDLIQNVLLHPEFNIAELSGFRAAKDVSALDDLAQNPHSVLTADDGWISTSVPLALPPPEEGVYPSEELAAQFLVKGLFYRSPVEVVKAALTEKNAQKYHLSPFSEYWEPFKGQSPERIYSEVYNSSAFLEEQRKVDLQHAESGSDLEPIIIPLLLWSDSTHLTSFGTASLWPVYAYLGNESKYTRGKPTSFSAHHIAYIPKLDDSIQDFYTATFGVPASADVLRHLRHELMQAIWRLILDDKFVDGYVHGIDIEFPDGVTRRMYLRIFIYSADYPEKVLVSCINYLGKHPCPRCLIKKCDIHKIGTKNDMKSRQHQARTNSKYNRHIIEVAREWIYSKGTKITSAAFKRLMNLTFSQIPSRIAFLERLGAYGFNVYEIFCPDLMHKFELGVWKATFLHLLRILYAQGSDGIQMLNQRFHQIPTFGRETIRKFCNNVSGLKKLAARDYEDLLQCAIPAFEGLLERSHNKILMDLLFELSTWHALAKLRLHTESTLRDLESSTSRLGTSLRHFENIVCAAFITRDLPSEEAARGRRKAALAAKQPQASLGTGKGKEKASEAPKHRKFNLSTYKVHALGDYPHYIRQYGTTDGTTTQIGELEHRRGKRHYLRSHRGKHVAGIAKNTRRERILCNLGTYQSYKAAQNANKRVRLNRKSDASGVVLPFEVDEAMPAHSPFDTYEMSHETKHPLELTTWLGDNYNDPALHGFYDQLRDHLLGRILNRGCQWSGDDTPFTDQQRLAVRIVGGRIYRHKKLRVNYTTYDMQRAQDSLNPRTHANIMLVSPDNTTGDHPYWYARVIGVFHAVVQHAELSEPAIMDFLWVRWYGLDPSRRSHYGWKVRRLQRVGFVRHEIDPVTGLSPSFGFIDPAHVLRGVHLIPAFHLGETTDDLPPSGLARLPHEDDTDYNFYYINYFVDRDMFMRFRGGGVGHKSTRSATDIFRTDRHPTDMVPDGAESDASNRGDISLSEPEIDDTLSANGNEWEDEDGNLSVSDGYTSLEFPSDSSDVGEEDEQVKEAEERANNADDTLGPEDGEYDEEEYLNYAEL